MTVFYLSVGLFGTYFLVSSFLAFAPESYAASWVGWLDRLDASLDRHTLTWRMLALLGLFATEYCWLRWL